LVLLLVNRGVGPHIARMTLSGLGRYLVFEDDRVVPPYG
jgi:hypothetical protein